MPRIANCLVFERFHSSFKQLRKPRSTTSRVKCLQIFKRRRKRKAFDLGERFNHSDFPLSKNRRLERILFDKAFRREHELIVKRRMGMLRQPSDTQLKGIDALKLPEGMHRQNIRESRSEAAIDNGRNTCARRERSFGQLLFDDVVVMPKIAEMTAGFNSGFGKKVIEM